MILFRQMHSYLVSGKCFPNSFLFHIWKIRWHLLPPGLFEMVFAVLKACCNMEVLLILCCANKRLIILGQIGFLEHKLTVKFRLLGFFCGVFIGFFVWWGFFFLVSQFSNIEVIRERCLMNKHALISPMHLN